MAPQKLYACPMKIIFMGTPDFAVPTLNALVEAGHDIVAVYSQPPRPAGRGKKDRPSAVQAKAEALGLPVRHPVSLKSPEAQAACLSRGVGLEAMTNAAAARTYNVLAGEGRRVVAGFLLAP